MSKSKILLIITLIYLVLPNSVEAMTFDRDYLYNFIKSEVKKQITASMQDDIRIEVSKIDPRINIQPCDFPLSANIPEKHNGRNVNIKIVCSGEQAWHLFIPVRIQTIAPILVANARLSKGTILSSENIKVEHKDKSVIRGNVISDINLITGARLKRNVSLGAAITSNNVCFVCKGQPVTIIAKSASLMVKSSGTALRDGSLGELISIKNDKSGRIIRAQVSAINQVIINL